MTEPSAQDSPCPLHQDRLWVDRGWTARVIKNEDDDGWAVSMTPDGETEPALIGPWTMGRDKKSPKPLDANAFGTLIKTASEVIRRHEQHQHALLNKRLTVNTDGGPIELALCIVPDEMEPYATLSAHDALGELLAEVRVRADFRFNPASARAWIENDFRSPERY